MLTLTSLTCNMLPDPSGLDDPSPCFSWTFATDGRGQEQSAYQVQVASTQEGLEGGDPVCWDSGKVVSDQSCGVAYAGVPLRSRRRYTWRVRAWDAAMQPGAWSEPAWFETALLAPEDWLAHWIAALPDDAPPAQNPAPYFLKSFQVPGPLASARVYVTGVGYYELTVNGQRVGAAVLDPAFTRYDRRVLYAIYDLAPYLRVGENIIGMVLGNGFFNQSLRDAWDFEKAPWRANPRLIFQAHLKLEDGSEQVVVSDESWLVRTDGPITFDAIRSGETWDGRREMVGWDEPDPHPNPLPPEGEGEDDPHPNPRPEEGEGEDGSGPSLMPEEGERKKTRPLATGAATPTGWLPARVVRAPGGKLTAWRLPVRVMAYLTPVAITQPEAGIFVVDFGQNFAGWVRLKASGPQGTTITLRYGEQLDAGGRLDQKGLNWLLYEGEFQTDHFILKGEGEEIFSPHFTYHGFRYVEISGYPDELALAAIEGEVVHTAFERAGFFECSHPLLNAIQDATLWSYRSNFVGYPTDCPQREKNGWTGDAHLAAEAGLLNFQSAVAYTKWLDDLLDEQRPDGSLPGIVPTGGWGYAWGNGPCWDSALVLIPWYLYLYCADRHTLAKCYPAMQRYAAYLEGKAPAGLLALGLGDWIPPFGAPDDYTAPLAVLSTAYYHLDITVLANAARVLDFAEDARRYAALAGKIKAAFNQRFYDPISGMVANGSQTALGTALACGLVDESQQRKVVRQLVAEVHQWGGRLNTGIHGAKFVLNALAEFGRPEVALGLAAQRTFPSFGYMLDQGATTLWECWDGAGSRNHIMFGDISAWFYRVLAGITPDPAEPGFRHTFIRPYFAPGITWVRAEHVTPFGQLRSAWRREDGHLSLEVTLPPNTWATLTLPALSAGITEGGRALDAAQEISILKAGRKQVVLRIGSGDYHFDFK
jgi:alpha-L-rhamnosidase